MGAVFSGCGMYRYRLWREIAPVYWAEKGTVVFIMLNPSTADSLKDDSTVRRCRGFTRRWGFSRLEVVNLFAFCATDPNDLAEAHKRGVDVVGPDNDKVIAGVVKGSELVVAAWGASPHPWIHERAKQVRDRYPTLRVLGFTMHGHPRHPLYAPHDLNPVMMQARR